MYCIFLNSFFNQLIKCTITIITITIIIIIIIIIIITYSH